MRIGAKYRSSNYGSGVWNPACQHVCRTEFQNDPVRRAAFLHDVLTIDFDADIRNVIVCMIALSYSYPTMILKHSQHRPLIHWPRVKKNHQSLILLMWAYLSRAYTVVRVSTPCQVRLRHGLCFVVRPALGGFSIVSEMFSCTPAAKARKQDECQRKLGKPLRML